MDNIVNKILMGVPQKGSKGGPQGHIPLLVNGLRKEGFEVIEIIYGNKTEDESFVEKIINVFGTLTLLKGQIKNNHFDIIHLNTAFDVKSILRDLIIINGLKKYNIPIFIKCHGSDENILKNKGIVRLGIKLILKWVRGIGVLSNEERQNFINAGTSPKKVFIVKNIVDTKLYVKDLTFKEKNGIAKDKLVLLFAARFLPEKGLIDLIEACGILKRKCSNFHLVCLGDGPQMEIVQSKVTELGISDLVKFTGYISEEKTKSFYANSDILVFPTFHQEGFPMVVFQSVAAGLPILTTKIRASADYLIENENCLWIQPKDSQNISKNIYSLINDSNLRQKFSINNLQLSKKFSEKRVSLEFISIYNIIGSPQTRLKC